MTAGFSKMRLATFMLVDLIPLSITSSITFYLGVKAGMNYRDILPYLDKFKEIIGITALLVVIVILLFHKIKKKASQKTSEQ
jgi:membrane protein DedA with SNARE-associated domain